MSTIAESPSKRLLSNSVTVQNIYSVNPAIMTPPTTQQISSAISGSIAGQSFGSVLNMVLSSSSSTSSYANVSVDSVSVLSISSAPTITASSATKSCFSGSEMVTLISGESTPISKIRVGDDILSANKNGEVAYSAVIAVPHGENFDDATFVQISTSGSSLRVTADHLVLAGTCDAELSLVKASDVSTGDCVQTLQGRAKISDISFVRGKGLYSVVTGMDYIVVNGFIVSPFALNHEMGSLWYKGFLSFIYVLPPKSLFQMTIGFYDATVDLFLSMMI